MCLFVSSLEKVMDISDQTLLEAIKLKDTGAFRVFYDRYVDLLYYWACQRTGDPDISRDIVQNFWITFWTNPEVIRVDQNGRARSFLIRFFSYRVLDYLRSAASKVLGDEAEIEKAADTMNYSHIIEELGMQEVLAEIEKVLAELPAITRDLFMLLWEKNCSVKEVATQFHMSERAVRLRYKKTLMAIQSRISLLQADDPSLKNARTALSFLLLLNLLK
ncbi:MAG: RNA polymerase sigma factor [Mangrovibacterium sp.]